MVADSDRSALALLALMRLTTFCKRTTSAEEVEWMEDVWFVWRRRRILDVQCLV
jgi:hypothetical protein